MFYLSKWQDDQMQDDGALNMKEWSFYVGEWKEGKRHGRGSVISAYGKRFVVEWEDSKLVKKLQKMK